MQVDTLYIESTAKSKNYDFRVFLPSVKIATWRVPGIQFGLKSSVLTGFNKHGVSWEKEETTVR